MHRVLSVIKVSYEYCEAHTMPKKINNNKASGHEKYFCTDSDESVSGCLCAPSLKAPFFKNNKVQ